MKKRIAACLAAAAVLHAIGAHAQSPGVYPAKTIRIVVPLAPGGNVDLVARALAQQISENVGQQVLIDNRPGASSLVGTQYAAKTPPDGYTGRASSATRRRDPAAPATWRPSFSAARSESRCCTCRTRAMPRRSST
jgi:tripartite-type tricarboxylate transporter receptor subunit TctC